MPTAPSFAGRLVLSFESRRAREIESLIESFGGRALVAPAMKELPMASDEGVVGLAKSLIRGDFDAIVFLTGVGVRAALDAASTHGLRDELIAALGRVRIITRGPKPVAALREVGVSAWMNAPEPNTWRELIAALDERAGEWMPKGQRVAVQEYGVSNTELLAALRERGATVTAVQAYRWAMPDDIEPIRAAANALSRKDVDVVLITTGVQVIHFWRVVTEMGIESDVRAGLAKSVIASIGPSASAELRRHGFEPTFEPTHPKMGLLVREAAQTAGQIQSGHL
jgi:uroporphyrinogen-III synthase